MLISADQRVTAFRTAPDRMKNLANWRVQNSAKWIWKKKERRTATLSLQRNPIVARREQRFKILSLSINVFILFLCFFNNLFILI